MGTIFLINNKIRFVIYTKDHAPAHVHVISPKGEAKIEIESLECFYSRGYTQKELNIFIRFISQRQAVFMEAWNEYHS